MKKLGFKKIVLTLLLLVTTLTLVGCFSFGGTTPSTKIELEQISLTASSTAVTVGETVIFSFSPHPTDAETYNDKSYNVKYIEYFIGDTRFDKSKSSVEYTFNTAGEYEVWAKYCTHSNHTTTNGDIVSNKIIIKVSDIDERLILRVNQPSEQKYNIPQPNKLIDHSETTTFQSGGNSQFTFNYTVSTSGYHYFYASFAVYWTIKDSNNNTVRSRGSASTSNFGLILDAGKRYTFIIERASKNGECKIDIYSPNEVKNISNYTEITDSMRFDNQKNSYLYTPNVTGRFYITSSMALYYLIQDDFGNTVRARGSASSSAFGINLESGKQYKITVEQASKFGDYTINVNNPNPVQSIEGKLKVYDNMRFKTQNNIYTFTADKTGEYIFSFSYNMYVTIKDKFGNTVRARGSVSTKNVKISLTSGMEYTLILEQSSSFGEYIIDVKKP